jgi:hypothetical protein
MSKLKNKLFEGFNLAELGVDFMGYEFDTRRELTYHHIQPKNCGGKTTYGNGALLIKPSHNYIHIIEAYDYKLFIELSRELIAHHVNGEITPERLAVINQILEYFESKYGGQYTKRGGLIIKEEYTRRRKL